MKRIVVAILAIATLTMTTTMGPANAQDSPELEVDPGTIEEAGEHEFDINGSGYTGPLFVLPCPGAEGDPDNIEEDSCDVSALSPATPDVDGNFTVQVTYMVPEEGLVIVGGNAEQTEVAATVIRVGAAEATTADVAEAASSDDAPEAAAEASTEGSSGGDLARTGSEPAFVLIVALAALMGGTLALHSSRQLGRLHVAQLLAGANPFASGRQRAVTTMPTRTQPDEPVDGSATTLATRVRRAQFDKQLQPFQ